MRGPILNSKNMYTVSSDPFWNCTGYCELAIYHKNHIMYFKTHWLIGCIRNVLKKRNQICQNNIYRKTREQKTHASNLWFDVCAFKPNESSYKRVFNANHQLHGPIWVSTASIGSECTMMYSIFHQVLLNLWVCLRLLPPNIWRVLNVSWNGRHVTLY